MPSTNPIKFLTSPQNLGIISNDKDIVTVEWVKRLIKQVQKDPVKLTTTTDIGATYNSLDMTLTINNMGKLVIDGIDTNVDDRVLIKDQINGTENGIYVVTNAGSTSNQAILTRADDFNSSNMIPHNAIITVMQGNSQADTIFMLTNDGDIILDSTSLVFSKYPTTEGTVKSVSQNITGDGSTKEFTIFHGLNTEYVITNLYDIDNNLCFTSIRILDKNNIIVSFDNILSTNEQYTIIIQG